jgi:hypothetical protein
MKKGPRLLPWSGLPMMHTFYAIAEGYDGKAFTGEGVGRTFFEARADFMRKNVKALGSVGPCSIQLVGRKNAS